MIVIEKNTGDKIPYEVDGKKITFDDDLTINLAKRQSDDREHIDVCFDRSGEIVVGAAAGRSYVAEIDLPAREYTTMGEGENATTEPLPLDMDKVTLTLWAIA
jgi:hypothetical protein